MNAWIRVTVATALVSEATADIESRGSALHV
jgi:hypothetical protein